MLNSKALSQVLSKNSDDRVCKRWFLMTPNGTLLAYSQPADIPDLRRQAAKAALLWQDSQTSQQHGSEAHDGATDSKDALPNFLHILTVESETGNTLIRSIQANLLLVLEGGVPPRRPDFEPRTTLEGPGDRPYTGSTSREASRALNSSASSIADSTKSHVSHSALALQRRKLDALAAAIAQSLERTGFRMPEEGNGKIF